MCILSFIVEEWRMKKICCMYRLWGRGGGGEEGGGECITKNILPKFVNQRTDAKCMLRLAETRRRHTMFVI